MLTKIARRVLLALCLMGSVAAAAEPYPEKNVRVIVPFPVGASTDSAARIIFAKVSELLGQKFYIENRPGAFGLIGVRELFTADPDGYTIGYLGSGQAVTLPAAYEVMQKPLQYNPLRLEPIAFGADLFFCLVVPADFPASTAAEFAAYAKRNPGKLFFATPHWNGKMLLALLNKSLGLSITPVAYNGEPKAFQDMLGGQVQGMFATSYTAVPQTQSGTVKTIAVAAKQRLRGLESTGTFAEQGIAGFETLAAWEGLFGPPGLERGLVMRLNQAFNAAMQDSEVLRQLAAIQRTPAPAAPDMLKELVRTQYPFQLRFLREQGMNLLSD